MNSGPRLVLIKVARVRLAVQQLLRRAAAGDRCSQALQRGAEKRPVSVGERRRLIAARNEVLSLCNSIGEMRRRDIERPHAAMKPLERRCVVGWRDRFMRYGFVVGPQRDHEAVPLVGAWRDARLESRHRAAGCGQPLRKLDFERCDVLPGRRHPGEDVTGREADR
jgi:hypothetical protein